MADLSITRPLDEITAAHLDRTFADTVGADRTLATRMHALAVSAQVYREPFGPVEPTDAEKTMAIVTRAEAFEAYLRGDLA